MPETPLTEEERDALAGAMVEAEALGGKRAFAFNVHVWLAARDFYSERERVLREALSFYAQQKGLGAVLASDAGARARRALEATDA